MAPFLPEYDQGKIYKENYFYTTTFSSIIFYD